MSFTNPTISATFDNDVKLNLNQSTIDLLNAAIASHSHTQLQQVQQLLLSSNMQPQQPQQQTSDMKDPPSTTTTVSQGTTPVSSKRSIDSTDESDANLTTTPKRPGRKPLEKAAASDAVLDPKQKRKAQNRAAQRAFRERKDKFVQELQERIRELEELTSKTDEDLVQENNLLKEQLKQLEEENYALKDAKFTFEFPVTNPSTLTSPTSDASPTNTNTTTTLNDIQEDTSGSSCTEQSPRSLNQEDDSDTPATKTPTSFQDPTAFLSFGSIAPSQDFDFLAFPGNDTPLTTPTTTTTTIPTTDTITSSSGYDMKDLFHNNNININNKDDPFGGYRAPSDDLITDDFLLANTGLPALFGGSGDDDLFGFNTSSQFQQHAPFVLDQFYMPDEPRPHVRKETLQVSLQRAKQNGVRAFEVQEQLKNCPDFNLDDLCADLKAKASCCESKYVLTEHDVESYLQCFGQQL